jgi:hypothetical protein
MFLLMRNRFTVIRRFLSWNYSIVRFFLTDPVSILRKLRGIPYLLINAIKYIQSSEGKEFSLNLSNLYYSSYDRFAKAGDLPQHYFLQDLWAAQYIYEMKVATHVDVGSRMDGFVAHVLSFAKVKYVDIRPFDTEIPGLTYIKGSVVDLPFDNESIVTISCLHVIEHIGLGRYGDPVDPSGYLDAAKELSRVLKQGGTLLLGTPVGHERLCFDAHRIFDPLTIVKAFDSLQLKFFSLIDDGGEGILKNASFNSARQCNYGCGLFVFKK